MDEPHQPTFVIGMPARDEELLIADAIDHVLASADNLDHPTAVRLVVACDTCNDATGAIARRFARRDERVSCIEGTWMSAGAARAAAIRQALASISAGVRLRDIWVATTDADTMVPADWLTNHANCWACGNHAVAGIVDVLGAQHEVRAVFDSHYALGHASHGHVHGANLGVRADAYTSVGGFAELGLAEDHALWRALRDAGFTCRASVSLRVVTSARLQGRAVGGFADTLRGLVEGEQRGSELIGVSLRRAGHADGDEPESVPA